VVETNVLYYGDNLDILRKYIPDASIDLVYLDPPFNSNRDYNVIFKDESGRGSDAQLLAFEDTWHWGPGVDSTYRYLTNTALHHGRVPDSVSAVVGALRQGLGTNQMTAYLVEMAVRLVELYRVLKPSGSLYLHCDPTASHYLKLLLDAIFGPENFKNEVIWKRTSAHSSAKRYGPVHDVLLFFGKSDAMHWVGGDQPYDPDYVAKRFTRGGDRPWKDADLTGSGVRHGETGLEWRGFNPTLLGRHWGYPPSELDRLDAAGLIYWPKTSGKWPRLKRYLDESRGVPLQDVWTDIAPVNSQAKERLGWDTQKPLALLERVVLASSDVDSVVLDPFCGCGTALVASQKLGRRWIGIDVTHLSIAVMRARLRDSFPELDEVRVIGQPTEVEGARMLAKQSLDDRYEFQYWALSLVDAQPIDRKKGADAGIDGRITFTDAGGQIRPVLVSVKSGHVNVAQVRDLVGTMKREAAPLGLFVTLEPPSKPMLAEAVAAGTFQSELSNRTYPAVQILTIESLLGGAKPQLPLLLLPTYQPAERVEGPSPGQVEMFR
jgi:DNA modification methylase